MRAATNEYASASAAKALRLQKRLESSGNNFATQVIAEHRTESMSLFQWLDKTMTHQRGTNVKDAVGGNTPTWATQNSGVACAVWPNRSSLVRDLARRDIVGTHAVVTDSNIGVAATDRLLIDGVYYVVNGVQKFSNAFASSETLYLIDTTIRNQT